MNVQEEALKKLQESTDTLRTVTEQYETRREFAARPWAERTCNPTKRKARRAAEVLGKVIGVIFLAVCAVVFAVWAWHEPVGAGIMTVFIGSVHLAGWLIFDDTDDCT